MSQIARQTVRTFAAPVSATFNYYTADEPPTEDDVSLLTDSGRLSPFTLLVHSIRQSEEKFTLDVHGFQILKHNSSLLPPLNPDGAADFHSSDVVKSTYWPEITALLREQFGARTVAIINTTVRDVNTRDMTAYDHKNPRKNPNASFPPFFIVHGDYTAAGACSHLRAVAPTFYDELGTTPYTTLEERDAFLSLHSQVVTAQNAAMKEAGVDDSHWDRSNYAGPRWAMFSVWRPLSTVQRSPLALVDPRDLTSSVELPRVYRNRPGFVPEYKSANLIPRGPKGGEEHRWYWLPDQKVDEVLAIKLFDSESQKKGGPVFGAPHSAFELEGTSDFPPRRSAELRAIVIW
ncbi:hypothetical protein NA56DRAFT_648889 [Hyaloscypha hepaticicola]|uniref:GA4 desaturase n=1 Tax=Hyaloscypha hepaticicola TaxID=2082293 RepID=A0A2J6PSZ7_9HELO|nr:hypothetical protein NA56DRAFT_648889 [Hyaloscypha hepaticicola]